MIFQEGGYVNPYAFFEANPWVLALLILLVVSVHIILSIWVYKDAKKEELASYRIWIAIVALSGIVGFILYLIRMRKK